MVVAEGGEGQAEGPGAEERGMEEMVRVVSRVPSGWRGGSGCGRGFGCWGAEVGVVVGEENQAQGDQEEGACDGAGGCDCALRAGVGIPSCGLAVLLPAARACCSHISRVLWSTGQTSPPEDAALSLMADVVGGLAAGAPVLVGADVVVGAGLRVMRTVSIRSFRCIVVTCSGLSGLLTHSLKLLRLHVKAEARLSVATFRWSLKPA